MLHSDSQFFAIGTKEKRRFCCREEGLCAEDGESEYSESEDGESEDGESAMLERETSEDGESYDCELLNQEPPRSLRHRGACSGDCRIHCVPQPDG